jgi:hypothetical protein
VIRQDLALRSFAGMSSVPEISLTPMSSSVDSTVDDPFGPTFSTWKPIEVPAPSRPSPTPLVLLALLAGIGAMVLGGVAVVAATGSDDEPAPPPAPPAKAVSLPTPKVERQALALLAKPSTDRVVFRGSRGHLVLVVGSGGRAAILIRGFARADAGSPYYAWVVGASGKPVRAAGFTGAERAVLLSTHVGRKDSVVVAPDRTAALRPRSARIVAVRD